MTFKTTIDVQTLAGFARQYNPTTAFKPYWKNERGVSFYGFLESFGYAGSCLDQHKTRNGYINVHITYPAKQAKPTTAQVTMPQARQIVSSKAPNRGRKTFTISRTDVARLAALLQQAGVRVR